MPHFPISWLLLTFIMLRRIDLFHSSGLKKETILLRWANHRKLVQSLSNAPSTKQYTSVRPILIAWGGRDTKLSVSVYRVSQEESSIFWEIIISSILSKKVYIYMFPIPNGFRDRAISVYSTLYTVQTSNTPCPHTSCKVHWCWRWNFRKRIILGKLYQLSHLNNTGIRNST
jgi:hypothetical protein